MELHQALTFIELLLWTQILCEQQRLINHDQQRWSIAFLTHIFGFCVKLALVSLITHQQCKDSVSVLNPLESPAAFLCLKHNVRLRPMHGAGKAKFDCQKLEGVHLD